MKNNEGITQGLCLSSTAPGTDGADGWVTSCPRLGRKDVDRKKNINLVQMYSTRNLEVPQVSDSVLHSSGPEDGISWGLALQTPARSPTAASKLLWVKNIWGRGTEMQGVETPWLVM